MNVNVWTGEVLSYAHDHGWDISLTGFSTFPLRNGGAELECEKDYAVVRLAGFESRIEQPDDMAMALGQRGLVSLEDLKTPTRLEVMTFYMSEADRKLELLERSLAPEPATEDTD